MAVLARVILVTLLAFLTSGVAHAYVESTTEESTPCADEERDADEEGGEEPWCPDDCIGPAHHCSCCSSLVVICPPVARLAAADIRDADRAAPKAVRPPQGVISRVERPPRG